MKGRPDLLWTLHYLPGFVRSVAIKILSHRFAARLSLDPARFLGKRVLVLGPARSVEDDLAEINVGSYDLFIKMNNGLDTPIAALGKRALRCDILFHSLSDEARAVTPAALQAAGVQVLVHRTAVKSAFLETLIAARRFADQVQVAHIPQEAYGSLARELGGASPTTGLVCCRFFMQAPVAEIAIVGFTFFQTSYHPGYDSAVTSDADAVNRVAVRGHHDPAKEARLLAKIISAARIEGRKVTLGRSVLQAMELADRNPCLGNERSEGN